VAFDRAHLLRRLGRYPEAAEAWAAVASGSGCIAVVAWIELAKLREHRLGDLAGALEATDRGLAAAERRRLIALPELALETDLRTRRRRLTARIGRAGRSAQLAATPVTSPFGRPDPGASRP
jgi:hypothetical protein